MPLHCAKNRYYFRIIDILFIFILNKILFVYIQNLVKSLAILCALALFLFYCYLCNVFYYIFFPLSFYLFPITLSLLFHLVAKATFDFHFKLSDIYILFQLHFKNCTFYYISFDVNGSS